MSDSWQLMQKMPCDVLAYRRFSIFLLQFRHRKQVAQKAWSPVRIARSSILLLHALQLYVQLLQIREPSPRRRRFASESRRVPQVLHRKQFRCHRFPAVLWSAPVSWRPRSSAGDGVERRSREASQAVRSNKARALCLRSSARPAVKQVGVKHKEAIRKKDKGQSTQQHTYQAQRPCPPLGSGTRLKKSQPCSEKTHDDAPLFGV